MLCHAVLPLSRAGYAEGAKYSFNSPGFDTATGYFTQIVWQDTRRIGCAQVLSGCSMNPIICHYFPPGVLTLIGGSLRVGC
jgi:hypothetical protein